ncbi:diaminopimelate decarboxylase [Thalassoporum mexicanum PCC 7367]|uniref:diaminopimelate decarboxylase n=1 Tax=Thalassoporum mexicanum TaxID=3457544 RepID=UPI00029FDCDC|nr:diaminopimelate decarboxylase [Pseudanabaena sp. PCC 7367]AFY70275.1 diaminopimelate decarboxylase [Pseudanabaena sp. PCC 7367]
MTTVLSDLSHQLVSSQIDQAVLNSLSPNQQLLPITAKINQADHLEIGGCDVVELVKRYGSPLYILDEASLRSACGQYRQAFTKYYDGQALVLYASKAWSCLAICAIVSAEGLGLDVVSGGELYTALKAGANPEQLYLHGNNKGIDELELAIEANITIVVDNWYELKTLAQLAKAHQSPTKVMLRITPGIECHTHEYIRTGHLDSKFGFDPNHVEAVLAFLAQPEVSAHLDCIGLHAHIGSQIFELQPHRDIAQAILPWFKLAQEKYGLNLSELNIGGGLGIRYTESDDPPSIDDWVKTVCEGVSQACAEIGLALPKLLCEPGRSLVGTTCVTAYTIGSSKTVPDIRTYITVDGGMSDNPRPITYQSLYRTVIANRLSAPADQLVTVAGKHCESGDILIKDVQLPTTEPGDVLVVLGTGAYNYSMASNYNRIPRPATVLVQDGEATTIIKRETYSDLLRQDILPERLTPQH